MAEMQVSSNGVTVSLLCVAAEIDDDDDDILEVTIDISNGAGHDLWDIGADVRTMNGSRGVALATPARIEAGGGESMTFWIPGASGAWLLKLSYNSAGGRGGRRASRARS